MVWANANNVAGQNVEPDSIPNLWVKSGKKLGLYLRVAGYMGAWCKLVQIRAEWPSQGRIENWRSDHGAAQGRH